MANAVFAGGRASALQNYLLGEERINRMIDATSLDDALKVLMEINFGDGFSISTPIHFEKLISIEEEKLYSFIKSTSPSEKLKEFLLLKNDYHNAEAFVRAKHLKIDDDKMLVNDGVYEKDKLKDLIFADDYKGLPKPLRSAIIQCDNLFISNKASGVLVSNIFNKAYFEHLYSVSKGDKILTRLFKNKVDCVNIGVAFRIRNYSKANSFFIDNGTLSPSDLKKLCENSFDELKVYFKFSPLFKVVMLAIEDAEKNKPLLEFEKFTDFYPVSLLDENKYSISGNLPFMRYVFNKLNDFINIRIIMIGLINGLDKNQIKNRLRII